MIGHASKCGVFCVEPRVPTQGAKAGGGGGARAHKRRSGPSCHREQCVCRPSPSHRGRAPSSERPGPFPFPNVMFIFFFCLVLFPFVHPSTRTPRHDATTLLSLPLPFSQPTGRRGWPGHAAPQTTHALGRRTRMAPKKEHSAQGRACTHWAGAASPPHPTPPCRCTHAGRAAKTQGQTGRQASRAVYRVSARR